VVVQDEMALDAMKDRLGVPKTLRFCQSSLTGGDRMPQPEKLESQFWTGVVWRFN
jgi:hypothetical protein